MNVFIAEMQRYSILTYMANSVRLTSLLERQDNQVSLLSQQVLPQALSIGGQHLTIINFVNGLIHSLAPLY